METDIVLDALEYRNRLIRIGANDPHWRGIVKSMQLRMARSYRGSMRSPLDTIRDGELIVIAPAICELIEHGFLSFPSCGISAELFPSPMGFGFFHKPPGLGHAGEIEGVEAFAWCIHANWVNRLTGARLAGAEVTYVGQRGISHMFWPFGPDDAWDSWIAEGASTETNPDLMFARFHRYCVLGTLIFMGQTITQTSVRVVGNRQARRQMQRLGYEPSAKVVELRRREYQHREHENNPTYRDYSCQWIVRGHWRNQWHPSLGSHQPKWITPYVKGPGDKPLKTPRVNVFAVVR